MTPPLIGETGTVKRDRTEWEGSKRRVRGPIDVGAVQVAPLIAPQRVQLCGPSAITAHSARHLTPPVLSLLPPPSPVPLPARLPALKPANPILSRIPREIYRSASGGYRVFLFKCTPSTCRRVDVHRPTWMHAAASMWFNPLPCRRRHEEIC